MWHRCKHLDTAGRQVLLQKRMGKSEPSLPFVIQSFNSQFTVRVQLMSSKVNLLVKEAKERDINPKGLDRDLTL